MVNLSKLCFRIGQANQIVCEVNKRLEAIHDSTSDELAKSLFKKVMKELEEVEALIGMELIEEIESDN